MFSKLNLLLLFVVFPCVFPAKVLCPEGKLCEDDTLDSSKSYQKIKARIRITRGKPAFLLSNSSQNENGPTYCAGANCDEFRPCCNGRCCPFVAGTCCEKSCCESSSQCCHDGEWCCAWNQICGALQGHCYSKGTVTASTTILTAALFILLLTVRHFGSEF